MVRTPNETGRSQSSACSLASLDSRPRGNDGLSLSGQRKQISSPKERDGVLLVFLRGAHDVSTSTAGMRTRLGVKNFSAAKRLGREEQITEALRGKPAVASAATRDKITGLFACFSQEGHTTV